MLRNGMFEGVGNSGDNWSGGAVGLCPGDGGRGCSAAVHGSGNLVTRIAETETLKPWQFFFSVR